MESMDPGRPVTIEKGGTWSEAAAAVLDTVKPGDLVLLQPDTVEQTVPWLAERYGARLKEKCLADLAGPASHGDSGPTPAAHEPVSTGSGRLGRGIFATREIRPGETVLRTWGQRIPKRTRHSMQVDADVHIQPQGVLVVTNHSCEPNCGVLIRSGTAEIEVRAMRPIAAGEEITIDYDTFEYEIEHMGGPCQCGSQSCRTKIAGYKHLPTDVKRRYGEFIAEYLRALDASEVTAPVGA
jgi:hypothetical protein